MVKLLKVLLNKNFVSFVTILWQCSRNINYDAVTNFIFFFAKREKCIKKYRIMKAIVQSLKKVPNRTFYFLLKKKFFCQKVSLKKEKLRFVTLCG